MFSELRRVPFKFSTVCSAVKREREEEILSVMVNIMFAVKAERSNAVCAQLRLFISD